MTAPPTFDDVSPPIRAALEGRGFTALTPVQEAVLDPALAGRDLRIFSQTGSGKTVAVGLAVAADLEKAAQALVGAPAPTPNRGARPFVLVIAPTRELATQIGNELAWLFEQQRIGVTAVTGGASYVRELAALRRGPLVVAGTPGRVLDHLGRGSIDPSAIGVVVLDEADQMLDLGFRDELEAILEKMPESRRTLLLSATFPREVQRLADRCQKDPVVAAAAGAGERNVDIAHVAHLVLAEERDRALLNLLLMAPGDRALVFVRTRESASDLADRLSDIGIPARALHGDLDQRDRTRTLDAFRAGAVTTLVATDVAARGLDVPDVTRVIHADPPNDAEVYTHRSGRTGRAGKKGLSIILIPPGMRERVRSMLRRAGVEASWSAAPSAAEVHRAADERLATELTATAAEAPPEPRLLDLADKLLATMEPRALVAALIARAAHPGSCEPREVTPILPPQGRSERVPHTMPPPARGKGAHLPGPRAEGSLAFVPFRINWGERQGADPRRLLALVCRRGGIRGSEVGAIRIGDLHSSFEVAAPVAEGFAQAVRKPDERDPRIRIDRIVEPGSGPPERSGPPSERTVPPSEGTVPERAAPPPPRVRSGPPDRSGPPPGRSGPPHPRSGPPREHSGPPHPRSGPPREHSGPPHSRSGPPHPRSGPADRSGPPAREKPARAHASSRSAAEPLEAPRRHPGARIVPQGGSTPAGGHAPPKKRKPRVVEG